MCIHIYTYTVIYYTCTYISFRKHSVCVLKKKWHSSILLFLTPQCPGDLATYQSFRPLSVFLNLDIPWFMCRFPFDGRAACF